MRGRVVKVPSQAQVSSQAGPKGREPIAPPPCLSPGGGTKKDAQGRGVSGRGLSQSLLKEGALPRSTLERTPCPPGVLSADRHTGALPSTQGLPPWKSPSLPLARSWSLCSQLSAGAPWLSSAPSSPGSFLLLLLASFPSTPARKPFVQQSSAQAACVGPHSRQEAWSVGVKHTQREMQSPGRPCCPGCGQERKARPH